MQIYHLDILKPWKNTRGLSIQLIYFLSNPENCVPQNILTAVKVSKKGSPTLINYEQTVDSDPVDSVLTLQRIVFSVSSFEDFSRQVT